MSDKPHSTSKRLRTAYHEAGHAVLSSAINDRPRLVTIRPTGHVLGFGKSFRSARPSSIAQVCLAGYAAEHILVGREPRQYTRKLGFAILAAVEPGIDANLLGLEGTDEHGTVEATLAMGRPPTADDVRAALDRPYDAAKESLTTVWPCVEAVAKAPVKREELDRSDLDELLGGTDLFGPVFAVQTKYGYLKLPKRGWLGPQLARRHACRPRRNSPAARPMGSES